MAALRNDPFAFVDDSIGWKRASSRFCDEPSVDRTPAFDGDSALVQETFQAAVSSGCFCDRIRSGFFGIGDGGLRS